MPSPPSPRPSPAPSPPVLLHLPHGRPLRAATLRERRDRFLADAVLEDTREEVIAYCVNPGRMEAFSRPGARIWLSPATISHPAALNPVVGAIEDEVDIDLCVEEEDEDEVGEGVACADEEDLDFLDSFRSAESAPSSQELATTSTPSTSSSGSKCCFAQTFASASSPSTSSRRAQRQRQHQRQNQRQTPRAPRRLAWTWELIEHEGTICGANTQKPNEIAKSVLEHRLLPGLDDWVEMASERTLTEEESCRAIEPSQVASPSKPKPKPKPSCLLPSSSPSSSKLAESPNGHSHGKSLKKGQSARPEAEKKTRLDFWLRHPDGRQHFIEVKNCHLVYPDGHGYFPDSISARATRHVGHLAQLVSQGHLATALFIVVRGDIKGKVRPSAHHDPNFAAACRAAAAAGVRFRALRVSCDLAGFSVEGEVGVDLEVYDLAPIAVWVANHRLATGWLRTASKQRVANGPFPHEASARKLRQVRSNEGDLDGPQQPAATPTRKRPQPGVNGNSNKKHNSKSQSKSKTSHASNSNFDEQAESSVLDLEGSTSSKRKRAAASCSSSKSRTNVAGAGAEATAEAAAAAGGAPRGEGTGTVCGSRRTTARFAFSFSVQTPVDHRIEL